MGQYVYGKNVVYNLIKKQHNVATLYVLQGHNDGEVVNLAKKNNITIKYVSKGELDEMTGGKKHQGYVADVEDYPTYSIKELIAAIPEGKLPLIVALDGIQDPHNLGAVLRTGAAVGVDGVIIEKNRSVSLTGTVAKVSAGAIETVKVAQVTNLSTTLRELKKEGYWIVGTNVHEAQDYRSLKYDMPVVLVIGSEGEGMHRLVSEQCDFQVKLPMEADTESLNASVACGILLYEIYSQRFPL